MIKVETLKNGVKLLRMIRQKNLNAVNDEFVQSLNAICRDFKKSEETVRCVILTGGPGRAFSAGGNLKELFGRKQSMAMHNERDMYEWYSKLLSLRQLKCPVIAAVNGVAVGAGLALALSADIRLAARTAKFGAPFTRLGIHPGAAATFLLARDCGAQQTAKLLLTAGTVDADEALRLGLVAEVVDDAGLEARALEMAYEIAALPQLATELTLETLRAQDNPGIERALRRDVDAQSQCWPNLQLPTKFKSKL